MQIGSLENKGSDKVLDDEALKEAVKNAVQEVIPQLLTQYKSTSTISGYVIGLYRCDLNFSSSKRIRFNFK